MKILVAAVAFFTLVSLAYGRDIVCVGEGVQVNSELQIGDLEFPRANMLLVWAQPSLLSWHFALYRGRADGLQR